MYIKNKIKYEVIFCILFLFINIIYCEVKDLTFPGYHRLHYPLRIESYENLLVDKVIENIPKTRNTSIKTNYDSKYSIKIELGSTLIYHENGTRIYSIN